MIEASIRNHVRAATCAIGYSTVPIQDYIADQTQPVFEVLGTGFAVRKTTVMTNRHIIEKIDIALQRGLPENRFRLLFIHEEGGRLFGGLARILSRTAVMNPEWDVAFIGIQPGDVEITPLVPRDPWLVTVTEEVAACGYPYGTHMLKRSTGKIYRVGPVIQQGHISAVAPYDTSDRPTELLLDLRAAGGMSGSPVFGPSDGRLLGIIYAGWETDDQAGVQATTALALPVRPERLAEWLQGHDRAGGDLD